MTGSARDRGIKTPAFGATVVSQFASVDNPHKTGLFVRVIRRRGRMNGGTWWQITDGRGDFWELRPDMCEVVPGHTEVLRALAGEAGAPDTPPADDAPAVWWSPPVGVITAKRDAYRDVHGYDLDELPSDAVRLVPAADEMEEHFIDANERMGEALVKIGMALGLPRPTAQYHWGSPEILARIAEVVPAAAPTPTDDTAGRDWRITNPAHAPFCDGSCDAGASVCPNQTRRTEETP